MASRRKLLLAAGAAAAGAAGGLVWWQRSRDERALLPERTAQPVLPPLALDPAFPNPLSLPGADGMQGILDVAGALTIVATTFISQSSSFALPSWTCEKSL